jgi:GTP-binding protein HflX
VCIQKLGTPNLRTYVGPGKIADIMEMANATGARTIVVDDDLTPKQQLSMETVFAQYGGGDVKILDRTALILEIFAQHARTREGQLQVELAQLQYRLTRGPSARGRAEGGGLTARLGALVAGVLGSVPLPWYSLYSL